MEISCSAPCERDLDLVLMDLLSGWEPFGQWLGNQLQAGSLQGIAHSVCDAVTGESDLELNWQLPGGSLERLLIENKIDAPFQPRQAERYRERGQSYVDRGLCGSFRTMLFAPQAYLGEQAERHGFDYALSYEAVAEWIDAQPHAPELRLKKALLLEAIRKGRRMYEGVDSEAVSRFWRDFATLANVLAPQLQMNYSEGARPEKSDTITFRPEGLPSRAGLWLRFPPGANSYVQLLIPGAAANEQWGSELLKPLPSESHWLRPAGKSLAVGCDLEPIDTNALIAEQSEVAMQAIQELERLRCWMLERRKALEELMP